jgi:hypothetical protein
MTVKEFAEKYSLKVLSTGNETAQITGGFCGDLLSWVMAKSRSGQAWFTVMGNINSIAVASLNELAAIVLCQNAVLMSDAQNKAKEENIWVLSCPYSSFEMAGKLYEELK